MRLRLAGGLLVLGVWLGSCSAPTPAAVPPSDPAGSEVSDVSGAAGGGEDIQGPNQLTGVPGIDRAQDLEVRVLDAQGAGRIGGTPGHHGSVDLGLLGSDRSGFAI